MNRDEPTLTPIRKSDKDLLKRIAKARDWSQTSAVSRAIRRLAEAEGFGGEGVTVGVQVPAEDESDPAAPR